MTDPDWKPAVTPQPVARLLLYRGPDGYLNSKSVARTYIEFPEDQAFPAKPDAHWKSGAPLYTRPIPQQQPELGEGELWSWVRSVMSQGADIRCDYEAGVHKGYEAYSARLDAAASERAAELCARMKPEPNQWGAGYQDCRQFVVQRLCSQLPPADAIRALDALGWPTDDASLRAVGVMR